MSGAKVGWRSRLALVVLAVFLTAPSVAHAQRTGPNEREIKPTAITKEDAARGVWALDFIFKDPRQITVDLPGRGKTVIWYMWYQVINRTDEPQRFTPRFELVTLDKHSVHVDRVHPKAHQAIVALENPLELQPGFPDHLRIRNSVTISAQPIPISKAEAAARTVTGVAMWDDVNPDTTRFSIFVTGLSNGWAATDDPADPKKQLVRRKTLQLNFRRLGDRYFQDDREIRFERPHEWIYRATKLNVSTDSEPAKKEEAPVPKPEKP